MKDCMSCQHYYSTYNAEAPHGCRALKFESKKMPCDIVEKESGMRCQLHASRKQVQPQSGKDPKQ